MPIKEINKKLLENFSDGQWLLNSDDDSIIVNDAFWKKIGERRKTGPVPVNELYKYVFHEDIDVFESLVDPHEQFVETTAQIIRFIDSKDDWIWFDVKVKQLKEEGDRRFFLFFDISGAKVLEQSYVEQFDSINKMGGWYVNVQKMEVFWTPSLFSVHGLKGGKAPPIEDAINFYKEGESRERLSRIFQRAIKEGASFDGEFEFVDAKGVEKWVRSRGKPVFKDGVCTMVYGTLQDITKDKKKEFAIKENRRRFEEVFNSTYQFCAIVNEDGTLLEVNKTLLSAWAAKAEDVVNLKLWEMPWWKDSKKKIKSVKQFLGKVRNGEFVRYNLEAQDRDGVPITIDFSLKPIQTSGSSAFHIIAEGRMIQDLVDAKKSLESMVRKITTQNEKLRNFAHIVSHNLRSHAINISLLSDILKDSPDHNASDNLISMLSEASSRLTETISHVTDVVAINDSNKNDFEKVNLLEIAKEAVSSVSTIISSAGAKVELDIPAQINVEGIPAYVESIFLNLITNAVKYRSEERPGHLVIRAIREKSMVRLEFEDNGIGIDLAYHGPKLFGMYKTFHGNADAKGIGLFITKNQIEAMGGKITTESQLGVGTTFTVNLNAG